MTEAKCRLLLNMIVKNETDNLEANFRRVKDLVDGIVLLDTGSSDDTIEKAETLAKSMNVPIKIFQEPFVNFGISRTRAYRLATE